jgi:ABC-2 type transport system permease protein
MKDLLYKEFRLWWHPASYIFLLFGTFLLFPNWPYFIAFGYIFISFNAVFISGRGNQDIIFAVSLPVRKRDTVLARGYFIAIIEILQILVAIPFAVINSLAYLKGNMIGMNPNFAFFGFILIMYGIFNIFFLPGFYKTAYKMVPMLLAVGMVIIYAVAVDIAVMVAPILRTNLDGLGASNFTSQLPVLLTGIVLFVSLTLLACQISADRFEKLDL